MKNTEFSKAILTISALVLLALALPVSAASTKEEVKALQQQVESLKQGQEKIQKDLADIKKLLEAGVGSAPVRPAPPVPFEPADLLVGESAFLGSAEAAVTMFTYSDYQCQFCSRHASTVLPQLISEYVDNGKLRIVMREYPIESIHPRAFAAAQAALCAGMQGKYWPMHDLIFASPEALSDDDLKAHIRTLGLDADVYESCLTNEAINHQIRVELQEGQRLGISGTPSFVVGLTDPKDENKVLVTKYVRGAQPLQIFKEAIDELLAEAAGTE